MVDMCFLTIMYQLQRQPKCMRVYKLVGFYQFFKLKPCEVDVLHVHELMSTLQEDKTYQLNHKDSKTIDLNLFKDIVTKTQ